MSAAIPNAALDARGVMWLLGAMLFVVAPHLARMPEWVGAFFVLMVAWRGWVAWRARHFPMRWVVFLLTVAAAAGTPSALHTSARRQCSSQARSR